MASVCGAAYGLSMTWQVIATLARANPARAA
jgi:hypothetical protein